MTKEGCDISYLKENFPRISDVYIKEEIFVGLHIRKLFGHAQFYSILERNEKDYFNT